MVEPRPALPLERRIWLIRGQRVMLDADLAALYGVPTRHLNQQVKRNATRFPERYAFRLTKSEAASSVILRSQNAILGWGRHTKYLPLAFTEHGAVMLASVLKSDGAVTASIRVVDAFIRLRALVAERDGLGRKMRELENKVQGQAVEIGRIFEILEDLTGPGGDPPSKQIGFKP